MPMTMPRRLFATAFLVLALTPVSSADHPVTMWEVEGNNNRVFILGSIHLLRPSDYPIPAVIDAAYAEAEALVMELDMDDMDPLAMQSLVQQLGMISGGGNMADITGARDYAEIKRLAGTLGIPIELLGIMEPWLAAVSVEVMLMTAIGFNPEDGIESYLSSKASRDGKEISGLETERQQLEMLDGLSNESQTNMLLQILRDGDELGDMLDQMIEAWRYGDIAFLEENLLEELAQSPELYNALVRDRNREWVTELTRLTRQSEDYLVIVGALHLIGPDGVPELLRKRGLDVKQMETAGN